MEKTSLPPRCVSAPGIYVAESGNSITSDYVSFGYRRM
ncbi:hypothetical protein BURPS668_0615 [Burkholderia pseudomallei 668]|nr:hypothetical protein BURPS668_0615 [Burkholderia pseudomallei 668]EEP86960.1 conserved hypothetical protein [Burkholderia mallei GB8 horse 4]